MALDRLDAIIIGANAEGLFAAIELARAGRHIAVIDRKPLDAASGEGRDAVVSVAAVREFNLSQHGLRLVSAPAVVGLTSERALILWPDAPAAQASIAAQSPRDGDAFEYFRARIARVGNGKPSSGEGSLTSWLLAANGVDEPPSDRIAFRASPMAGLLDEIFDTELLKGMLAHGALAGTAVSPKAPGSAALLARYAGYPANGSSRFVAGGELELRRALLGSLKFYNNADIHFGAEVNEISAEREAVQSVILSDGTVFSAPIVISTLGRHRTMEALVGSKRQTDRLLPSNVTMEPVQVRYTVVTPPKFARIDAATVASGAIVRLNPSLERLAQAHGAYRAQQPTAEPCLELRVIPAQTPDRRQRWEVFASALFIPEQTSEGSLTGSRRERLIALCMKTIEHLAPGFNASVESAVLTHPREANQSLMDAKSNAQPVVPRQLDADTIPEIGPSTADILLKGLFAIDANLFAPAGEGGLLAALGTGLCKRSKTQVDA